MVVKKFLYEEMSWPELRDVVKEDRVVVVPVGMLEDHGLHLPVVTDVMITGAVCRRAAEGVPDSVVLMPVQQHGYSPHHMDFSGSITVKGPTLIEYMLDVTRSLVRHGFRRILIVNGHGSNMPWLEAAARMTIVILAAASSQGMLLPWPFTISIRRKPWRTRLLVTSSMYSMRVGPLTVIEPEKSM